MSFFENTRSTPDYHYQGTPDYHNSGDLPITILVDAPEPQRLSSWGFLPSPGGRSTFHDQRCSGADTGSSPDGKDFDVVLARMQSLVSLF